MTKIRDLTRTNGAVEVPFGKGYATRNSVAWHPDTGDCVRANVPRIANKRIPVFTFKPRIFHTFTEPTTFMSYDPSNPIVSTKWMVGSGGRQEQFESEYPEFEKLTLGSSYDGRDIVAYRLPKTGVTGTAVSGTKHFVISSLVHGNEADGVDGLFKACEILARNAAFANFRNEWTLLFIPAMNPDGFYKDTRNLSQVGPNGNTVNLNRNWNWFWNEYVETSYESKGASAHDTNEAQAFINYWDQVTASGGRFGAVVDFHSTGAGIGSRYQSRDRNYSNILYKMDEGGEVPDSYITMHLDWYIYQLNKAMGTLRLRDADANGKDLFIRYYKSRFAPHMHAYCTQQGAYAMIFEEVKVSQTTGNSETVASACNFRLDAALTVAAAVTSANWEYEDAILIEKATTNLLTNASWVDWQDDSRVFSYTTPEERPSYWHTGRSTARRITQKDGDKFFKDNGEAVRITGDLDISLDNAAEYSSVVCDGYDSIAIVSASGNVYSIPSERYHAGNLFAGGLTKHTSCVGAAACRGVPVSSGVTHVLDILGGGTSATGGATCQITRVETDQTDGRTPKQITIESDPASSGTGFTARMHAGFCDNYPASTADASIDCYLFGGLDAAGTPMSGIGKWEPNSKTFTTLGAAFPSGIYGACAVYVPDDSRCYIFGGIINGAVSSGIYEYNIGSDALTDLSSKVGLPSGLAFMAGDYIAGLTTKGVYLFGGEESTGQMHNKFYKFTWDYDLQAGDSFEIEEIFLESNLDDAEDDQMEHHSRYFDDRIGRWNAATMYVDEYDKGQIYIAGGRKVDHTNGIDEQSDDIYVHDALDETIGKPRYSQWAYFRYSTSIKKEFITPGGSEVGLQFSDDFSSNIRDAYWNHHGFTPDGSDVSTAGTSGVMILCNVTPNYVNEMVRCTAKTDDADTIGDFSLTARATYDNDRVMTSGYRLKYDSSATTWSVERTTSAGTKTIQSHVATGNEKIPAGGPASTIYLKVVGRDPVELTGSASGIEVIDCVDMDTARVTNVGTVAIEASGAVSNEYTIDDFALLTSGQNEERFTMSVHVKSPSGNTAGYVRPSIFVKDSTGPNPDWTTRYVSNYYTLPPTLGYYWYHGRVDLREGSPLQVEDGIRLYHRIYKDDQQMELDGVHLAEGTLLTSSYQHPDHPRVDETFTFLQALNPNAFHIEFYWVPTITFVDLDDDLELARISIDADNYIRLIAKAGTGNQRFEREYNNIDVYGPHDPTIELEKVRAGSVVSTASVICYWNYDLRDPGVERREDIIKFQIDHIVGDIMQLKIDRFGYEGRGTADPGSTAYTGVDASIIYNGVGYYGCPTIRDTAKTSAGRRLPTRRKGLHSRLRGSSRSQVMMGERDTQSGELTHTTAFWPGDNFNRADIGGLGPGGDWTDDGTKFYEYGTGWTIQSSGAVCAGSGFRRYDYGPGHADVILKADVAVNNDDDRVGLMARWNDALRDTDLPAYGATGYGAELEQKTSASGNVNVVRWYKGAREVLASSGLSSYTAGETLGLTFTLQSSSLTATIASRGSASAIDTNYKRPHKCGIYGQTANNSQEVNLDNFVIIPNFPSGVLS